MLAWALKAAENSGRDAAEVIASASGTADPAGAVLATTRTAGTQTSAPPWISEATSPVKDYSEADRQIIDYLNTAADEIRKRVNALTVDVTQGRPAWVNALGAVPGEHARHQEWLHHVGVVAAYRDQYQVISDDARQVLGPCAEPGHAGHGAYWRAAESVLTARTIASLERPGPKGNDVGTRVAADLYLGLPADERAAVDTAMAERLGVLWFGTRAGADDHAATRPMYAAQLGAVLTERGHLSYQSSVRESLGRSSDTILATAEEPIEAAFARRRAARQTTRDNAPRRDVPSSGIRKKTVRLSQDVASHRTAAEPTDHGKGPALPLHARPGNLPQDPGPVQ